MYELLKAKVKVTLVTTRAECLRMLETSTTLEGKKAWYYTHMGEIDMCLSLGLITSEEHTELADEWRKHNPQAAGKEGA